MGIGALIRDLRKQHGWSQGKLAEELCKVSGYRAHITRSEVSRWERGRFSPSGYWLQHLATALDVPLELLENPDVDRRSFLGGALAATVPLLDLTALEHLTAAARNARRYSDHELVGHLRGALDTAARSDGRMGPRDALPATLGIMAAINTSAREARPEVRRDLLAVGSRGAELAAWLNKDSGAPAVNTTYWYQQSKEWASATRDGAMYGYVLLRQAQAGVPPVRMLEFARAACTAGLPLRAHAEALQQEARALAMSGAPLGDVTRALDLAHAALDEAAPVTEPATCTGPLGDAYTREKLIVQSAICFREAGHPERAIPLFQRQLDAGVFALRDQACYTAHLSAALAAAGEPDEAATTALHAFTLAAPAGFGQTFAVLAKTSGDLRCYAKRPAVAEFQQKMAALTA